jgi:hypothetical protein
MRISEDQYNLLSQIVDGYATVKEEFYYSTASGGTTIQQPSVDGETYIDYPDLEQLGASGFLVMTPQDGVAMTGRVYPTNDGVQHVEEARRLEGIMRSDKAIAPGSGGSRISWGVTLPVLEAVVALYGQADAGEDVSQTQVNQRLERDDGDSATSRAFEILERSGYLQETASIDALPGPLTVVPTERALQLIEGWPADGEVALARLVNALQTQIDSTNDEDEKGKIRRVIDAVQGVGENVAAEVLTKVIMGG